MSKLPLWALRVNVREGWQMISDIGHAVDVTWPEQNKEYNRWHSNTRKWWIDRSKFQRLYTLFQISLFELYNKKDKTGVAYLKKDAYFDGNRVYNKLPKNRTEQQHEVLYMLKRKSKNMSAEERHVLISMLHESDRGNYVSS
jgi:hypothetical protein